MCAPASFSSFNFASPPSILLHFNFELPWPDLLAPCSGGGRKTETKQTMQQHLSTATPQPNHHPRPQRLVLCQHSFSPKRERDKQRERENERRKHLDATIPSRPSLYLIFNTASDRQKASTRPV